MKPAQQAFVKSVEKIVTDYFPATLPIAFVGRQSDSLSPGTLRIVCEFPGPVQYPVLDNNMSGIEFWNAGNREPMTLRVLFADAWIEPYVTWAGDIAWRATADGRRAGLK